MDGSGRGHMRSTYRGALLAAALLLLAPSAAQSDSVSVSRAKAGNATCLGKAATLGVSPRSHLAVGTPGADVIVGTSGADQIRGRGGNDLVCGGGGEDLLSGGPGKDQIRGGSGDDLVLGGTGQDRLMGGAGGDHLDGDDGRDDCDGGGGANTYVSCEVTPDTQGAPDPGAPTPPVTPGHSDQPPTDPPDQLPTAVDDESLLDEDSAAISIDVLANDMNDDGGPIAIESVSEADHGEVSIAEDGAALTYEPEAGYCNDGEAPDGFTYTLNGGSVGTVVVTVACVTDVSANPALTPAFDPDVSDYTTRCTGNPLEVSGRAAEGTTVAVDDDAPAGGKFEATVPLDENQAFSFTITTGLESRDYFVRCLPAGFPAWEYEQFHQPSHDLYLVAPGLAFSGSPTQYVVIFDREGVPVWWDTESPGRMIDPTVLEDGTIAWWRDGHGFIVHDLSGNNLGEINTVSGPTDLHELQQEPDGDYLLISSKVRENIDLTAYGYGANEEVLDYIVEEVNPAGQLVWSWDTGDHVGLAETGRWWPKISGEIPRDIVHMNAIEPAGDDAVLVSLRHTDAIYKVDKDSGEILWKLGGTWTPKSLDIVGDPEGAYPLGGQHDVRLLPDGTITIHDNNTNQPSPPRAVRYEIDEAKRTATFVEELTDPLITKSLCCGSSRRSDDGSWLMSWGGDSLVGEYEASGQPNFRLGFGGSLFSYRAVPADNPALTISSLRAGMDTMHPR
jgi:Ca2+-binding RTX toxin-like protein